MSKQYQKQKAKWIEQGKQAEQNRIIEIIGELEEYGIYDNPTLHKLLNKIKGEHKK